MEIAKILVNQTTGHCMTRRRIPAGLVGGTVSVEFDDPIWDRLVKTVVFRGTEVKAAEFDGKTAVIPWEALEHPGPYLFFGIWGSDPDSALQLPLIEVRIGPIEDATDPTADPGTDPTLPIWAQLKQDVEELKKGGTGGAQSDWNAAEGQPGHILNRTHWTESGAAREILPETALMMTTNVMPITTDFYLTIGETYTVMWNGVTYTCVAREVVDDNVSGVVVGDVYTASDGAVGTAPSGEPFALFIFPNEIVADGKLFAAVTPLDGSREATIAIRQDGEIVHKIDNKYLPVGGTDLGAVKNGGNVVINEDGTMTAPESGGNVDFQVGETLKLENGVLSVNTTDNVEQDNTLPITSAGVFATVGNIEVLLKTI